MGNLSSAAHPLKMQVRGGELIAGRMTTAGASNPTKVTPSVGWTAVRTGVGLIVVTLPQAYKKILYVDANMIVGASSTKFAKVIGVTDGGIRAGATVTIELQNSAGTPADQTGLDLMFLVLAAQVK